MPIAADELRAMAARSQERADETTVPGLRDAYRQLRLGLARHAVQREAIDRRHTLGSTFTAEKNVAARQFERHCLATRRLVEP